MDQKIVDLLHRSKICFMAKMTDEYEKTGSWRRRKNFLLMDKQYLCTLHVLEDTEFVFKLNLFDTATFVFSISTVVLQGRTRNDDDGS